MPEYLYRIFNYQQMDWNATYYQMVMLCAHPAKVYKSAYYQTKNRWARDDPAFSVIQVWFLFFSTIAWGIAFQIGAVSSYFWVIFQSLVLEWLLGGLILSTGSWWLANKYLRLHNNHGSSNDTFFVEQQVEWQYAFDIHCNSFFVLFLLVNVLQFLLLPILLGKSFIALVLANFLYAVAYSLYFYITFLGYMALPFLHHTEKFLYPIVGIGGLFLSSILVKVIFGVTFNASLMSAAFYYSYRV